MKESHLHVRITEQQHRLLRLVAEAERCRTSDVVQRALTDYLRTHAGASLAKIGADLKRST